MNRFTQTTLRLTLAAAILAAAAILPQSATAQTIRYVKPSPEGTGDGLSWGTASDNLQKMINQSAAGDEIWVYEGTYIPQYTADGWNSYTNNYPTTSSVRDNAFVLRAGVRIYGGFTDDVTAGTVPSFGTPDSRDGISILSGNRFYYRIVIGVNIPNDGKTVLDGFTIDGTIASSSITVNGLAVSGGSGIYNVNSSPVLTHIIISENQVSGMRNNNSSPVLTDVTIDKNAYGMYNENSSSPVLTDVTISRNGRCGMYNIDSSPILTDVDISENVVSAGGTESSGGAGMSNKNSSPILTRVTIRGNKISNMYGAGMHNNNSSPILTDVIISGNQASGYTSGGGGGGKGGGIFNYASSSPRLTRVIISGNTAEHNGGGIYNKNSSPILTDVTISENTAEYNGGGMYNENSSPVLTDITISENTATSEGGGGMYNDNSFPNLTRVTLSKNQANTTGGGIYNNNSSPALTDVDISENQATGDGGGIYNNTSSPVLTRVNIRKNKTDRDGGGIYNVTSSSPRLTDVTISENTADHNGGGISIISSSPVLTRVTISGNSITDDGGGIFNDDSSPILTNVIISGNKSDHNGGGICNRNGSSPSLTNVTISGNTATDNGGGMYNDNSSPVLTNTIIWGNNTNVSNSDGSSNPVYEYSLVQGKSPGGTNFDGTTDPQFLSPQEATSAPTIDGDYHLKPGNSLIDRSNSAAYLAARDNLPDLTDETDLAGKPRLYGAGIDLGAYENAPVPSLPQRLTATPGDRHVTLTWEVPADDGGNQIERYEASIDGGPWISATSATGYTFTGLTNGQAYIFRVHATNTTGNGAPAVATAMPDDLVPEAPQNVIATSGDRHVTLTWTAPADNGGSPILSYEISTDGTTWLPASSDVNTTSYTFTGLSNGIPCILYVRATNAAGNGASAITIATPDDLVPGAPEHLIAAPGDGEVMLSWKAPTDNGGSPVRIYEVSTDGINWVTESGTSHTFTGLANGTTYTFRVRALNAAGTGPEATVTATTESYSVSLSQSGTYMFLFDIYGYDALAPLTVTVTNTGTQPTGTLTVTLTGADPDAFGLAPITAGTSTPPAITLGSIPTGGSGAFLLAPDFGLNAGTYTATVTVSGANGISANFAVSFTVSKATPTAAELNFTLSNVTYDDRPHPVTVTPAKGIEGLGAITVLYNGITAVPIYPGTYTVTADIAEGANYTAFAGLSLGTFTIKEPPTPVIRRLVTLLPTPGLTTDPPAGDYYINSGSNFTFRLTPDTPLPDGALPQVQTTRSNAPDGSTGIRITPNADGSYTVVVLGIRQNIEITLSTATDNAPVADGDLTLSAAPGAIVIANSRPDAATLRVYTPAGALVRLTTVPPGTTRLAVPAGIYIVTDGGAFRRKTVVLR